METDEITGVLYCPSYTGVSGAEILGVRQKDGTIAILPKPILPGDDFFEACQEKQIVPEEHFRFTGKCEQSNCKQWHNNKCTVASRAVELLDSHLQTEPLPTCTIRPYCTWYRQENHNACRMCKLVITEISL